MTPLRKRISCLALFAAVLAPLPAMAGTPEDAKLLETVRGFYGWVLQHGPSVENLQPKIRELPHSTRLDLDMTAVPAFNAALMQSGYFAPHFPGAVRAYYQKQSARLKAFSAAEFDQMAKDGRGPMMETEDVDIFFCAQEYEYKPAFVAGMKIKSSRVTGRTATAWVVSPLGWETKFRFALVNGRWLIAAYCVYQ